MFRWVHLIEAIASLVGKICRSICNVFRCPDHFESEEK